MLGECHLTLNRPGLARDAFRTAAKIDPTGAKTWNALAKASLALGDVPGAMAASRKAMVLGAAGPETTIVLAYGLMRQGRSLDAIKVLDAAAQDPRADPTVLCMLGRCYDTLGRTGQATSCYHQALRNDPANSLAKSLLSMTGRRGPGTP